MKLAAFRHKYSLSKTFIVYTTLFIFVVVFLLTLLVTRQYGSTLKRQQEDATIAAFSYSIRQIESMLASSRKSALALTQIAGVRDYLTGAYSTPLEQVELFREVIENILSAQGDSTNGIVFIDENGYASGHLDKWVFFNENNQTLAAVANSISGGVVPSFHIAGSYLQTEFLESIPLEFASYYRNNLSILAVQTYAYPRSQGAKSFSILLSIREEALMELIQPLADDSSLIMLLRKDGHYVAGKGCDFVGRTFSITDELSEDQPSGSRVVTMDGQRYQMIYCRSSNDSWMLTKLIPLSEYSAAVNQITAKTVWISSLIWILSCTIYSLWMRRILHPFTEIARKMSALRESRLDARLHIRTHIREYDTINRQFNEMAASIEELHRKELINHNEKLQLELRTLQSQINPHFLYNSIASIRWLATLNGANRVAEMLIELAECLRPIFREWSLTWPLSEELSFISHYMQLMHLRYDVRFTVENQLPEDSAQLSVPRFALQPILENACEHGMPPSGKLNVVMRLAMQDSHLVFTVSDDGAGIDPQTLERLNLAFQNSGSPVEQPKTYRHGIGLVNVNRRLALIYGEAFGLSIESTLGQGTQVTMRILASVPSTPSPTHESV